MSSHKAAGHANEVVPQGDRPSADIPISMLLDEVDGEEEAGAPLSDSALRSAHAQQDEDEGEDAEDDVADASLGRNAAVVASFGKDTTAAAPSFRVGGGDEPSLKPFREDSRVDRRIIEGMLRDRDTFIEEMEYEGFTQAAVLRRAAELGLSEALIRQVKGVAADLAGERPGRRPAPSSLGARTCLSCDRVFLSSGPGNRLCMRCRGGDAGLAQL